MVENISELMARDPFSYTKDDLKEIVAYFRKQRATFNALPPKEPKKTTSKAPSALSQVMNNLGDVGDL